MAPQFTLYGNIGSVTSERVRLMLVDQGFTDYEFVSLDFFKGEFKQAAHLERHPWGRVPAITLADGTHVYESRAICKYIALANSFPLLPDPKTSTALEQALFDQAVSVETEYFSYWASQLSGGYAKTFAGQQPDEGRVEAARKAVASHFEVLEGILAKQNGGLTGGQSWSLVDIYYVPLVQRVINLGHEEAIFGEKSGNVSVKAWWERCMKREPVKNFASEMVKFEDIKKMMEQMEQNEN